MTFDIRRYGQCCIVFSFAFSSAGSSTQSSAQNKVTRKIYTMSDSISFYYRNYRISAEFFWAQDKYSAGSELTVNFEDKAVSCSQIPLINPHFAFPPKVGGEPRNASGFCCRTVCVMVICCNFFSGKLIRPKWLAHWKVALWIPIWSFPWSNEGVHHGMFCICLACSPTSLASGNVWNII